MIEDDEWNVHGGEEDRRTGQNFGGSRKSNWNGESRSFQNRDRSNYDRNRGRNELNDDDAFLLSVDPSKVGKIIGKGGSKIRELEEQSGAAIKIREEDYNTKQTVVALIGDKPAQDKARTMILNLISEPRYRGLAQSVSSYYKTDDDDPMAIDWNAIKEKSAVAAREKWSKCPPIKKNFYQEHPEVTAMSSKEVETFRKSKNNIVVCNVEREELIPKPVTKFHQAFGAYPDIMREIQKQGFSEPSPIQCQAWPVLLSGRDLIGIAQTGTGKTLAFLLPALIHIEGQPIPREERGGPNVLVIAPTRELALQIEEEVNKYSYRNIRSCCVYGGGKRSNQVNQVESGVEIVIATPGRLNDLVEANVINVSSVTYIVLDEADRMLDMGFEPQIRKVLLDIRPDRQSVMTSATWPPNVRDLASKYMVNPVQVFVGSLDLAAVHSVTQTVYIVDENEKRDFLYDFLQNLEPEDKVMVFVGRKTVADDVASDLALRGINCQSIHGNRDQSDREQAIKDLKVGDVRILIATDVASRGIDITDITKVINYDFPRKNIEEYVHRVGRTGRAGRTGEAISLITRGDWAYVGDLIKIMEEAMQPVHQELYDMRDRYSAWKAKKDSEGGRSGGFRSEGRRDRW